MQRALAIDLIKPLARLGVGFSMRGKRKLCTLLTEAMATRRECFALLLQVVQKVLQQLVVRDDRLAARTHRDDA